jgi:heme-degrading monooxygenase HmoA
MLHVKVQSERLEDLVTLYRDRIIPVLGTIPGCRYAGMMQSDLHPVECISLTFWDDKEDADRYESSGTFQDLLREARPFFVESSESRIQLTEDLTLEYLPVPEEPVLDALPVSATSAPHTSAQETPPLWLRLVSLRLRPGQRENFTQMYVDQVIPSLRDTKGCRYIYLTENPTKPNEMISVTSWDTKEDAERYEQSGLFTRLLESQEHLLSDLYQWKRYREKRQSNSVATSEDLQVEYYRVLVGKDFR